MNMTYLGPTLLGDVQDDVTTQVALGGQGRTQAVRLVRLLDVQGLLVSVTVHSHL